MFLHGLPGGAGCSGDAPAGLGASESPGVQGAAIIGGVDSSDQAVVVIRAPDGSVCSGFMIAPRVALTAAHCLVGSVRNGLEGGEVGFGPDGSADTRAMANMFVHRRFSGVVPPGNFDLGVVRLSEDAPAGVTPLAWNREPLGDWVVGQTVRAVGFGVDNPYTQTGGNTRRTVDLVVSFLGAQHLYMGERSHNTCRGDSGGPILAVLQAGGPEVAIGLSSFGPITCDDESAKTRLDVHAQVIAEVEAAWSGPCAHDGVCPGDTSGCAFPDPDCDGCGFDGTCVEGCARVDLDCGLGQGLGDECAVATECEGRVCDVEIGVCAAACAEDGSGSPPCRSGYECVSALDGARLCRATGCSARPGSAPGQAPLSVLIGLLALLLIARSRRASRSAAVLH